MDRPPCVHSGATSPVLLLADFAPLSIKPAAWGVTGDGQVLVKRTLLKANTLTYLDNLAEAKGRCRT